MDDLTFDYAASELRYNAFMAPAYASALEAMDVARGSHGLDAGCGPGGLIPLLLELVEPDGQITAVDGSTAHLSVAEPFAAGKPVTLQRVDLRERLPFDDNTFDWVWCADVLFPAYFQAPVATIGEFARVVRPGGRVGIFFHSFQRATYLPGHSQLERKLSVAGEMAFSPGTGPELEDSPMDHSAAWLSAAGLHDVAVTFHPFVYRQPLPEAVGRYVGDYILAEAFSEGASRYGESVGLTPPERDTWEAISTPGSPRYLLDDPRYFCFQAPMLAVGVKPA